MAVVEDVRRVRSVGVEDVLRAGGFTRFHRKAVLVTGAAWTFVAMEILLVGFTVPLFTAIWGLSGSYAGWIAASALGGSLLGSLVLGPAADRVGRRRIFQAAILWYAVFTALTAFAWGPGSLSAFRFLAGIGLDRPRAPCPVVATQLDPQCALRSVVSGPAAAPASSFDREPLQPVLLRRSRRIEGEANQQEYQGFLLSNEDLLRVRVWGKRKLERFILV